MAIVVVLLAQFKPRLVVNLFMNEYLEVFIALEKENCFIGQ